MKKNQLFVLSICCLLSLPLLIQAQCDSGRYARELFHSYTIDSPIYTIDTAGGVHDTLKMTIYQPTGDTIAHRPVIIFAHGGSFVTSGGYRGDDGSIIKLCQTFAKRGYITATIDYRLDNSIFDLLDSIKALDVVMKAIGDGKAAVRFFRKDAYTTNTYRVDTNQIFFGGNSAGAILAVHLAYIDSMGQLAGYIQTVVNNNGGLEGNSGNQGYSSKVKAVINLAGGINNLAWYTPGDIPMVSCQGDADGTVPYECGGVLHSTTMGAVPTINICGCGAMKAWADSIGGFEDSLLTFPGADHVPWESNNTDMNMVINFVDSFMVHHTLCPAVDTVTTASIQTPVAQLNVYPNPNKGSFTVTNNSGKLYSAAVYNNLGQLVYERNLVNDVQLDIHMDNATPGFYILKLTDGADHSTIKTDKLIVE